MNHLFARGEALKYKATIDTSGQKVTKFIQTVFAILQNKSYEDIVCWIAEGTRFIVKKPGEFSEKILQEYFGHKNIASFIRQLYFYDFKRCASENNQFSFTHPYFTQDSSLNSLSKLRRKNSKPAELSEKSDTTEIPEKKVLIEKSEETWKSVMVQPANVRQAQYYDEIALLNFAPSSQVFQKVAPPTDLMTLMVENTLIVEDALTDLRSLRQKLERDNAELDAAFEFEGFNYFDAKLDASNRPHKILDVLF